MAWLVKSCETIAATVPGGTRRVALDLDLDADPVVGLARVEALKRLLQPRWGQEEWPRITGVCSTTKLDPESGRDNLIRLSIRLTAGALAGMDALDHGDATMGTGAAPDLSDGGKWARNLLHLLREEAGLGAAEACVSAQVHAMAEAFRLHAEELLAEWSHRSSADITVEDASAAMSPGRADGAVQPMSKRKWA